MKPALDKYVTLVELLELTVPLAEIAPLLQATLRRLEVEGVPGLVSMQFHANEAQTELGAVITFSDGDQMPAHTEMISGWDEFKRFSKMIKLKEMRVHGTLSPAAEAWIRQFSGPISKFEQPVAAFVR